MLSSRNDSRDRNSSGEFFAGVVFARNFLAGVRRLTTAVQPPASNPTPPRAQSDERTCMDELRAAGLDVRHPAARQAALTLAREAHTIAQDRPHALNAAFALDRFNTGHLIDEHGAAGVAH